MDEKLDGENLGEEASGGESRAEWEAALTPPPSALGIVRFIEDMEARRGAFAPVGGTFGVASGPRIGFRTPAFAAPEASLSGQAGQGADALALGYARERREMPLAGFAPAAPALPDVSDFLDWLQRLGELRVSLPSLESGRGRGAVAFAPQTPIATFGQSSAASSSPAPGSFSTLNQSPAMATLPPDAANPYADATTTERVYARTSQRRHARDRDADETQDGEEFDAENAPEIGGRQRRIIRRPAASTTGHAARQGDDETAEQETANETKTGSGRREPDVIARAYRPRRPARTTETRTTETRTTETRTAEKSRAGGKADTDATDADAPDKTLAPSLVSERLNSLNRQLLKANLFTGTFAAGLLRGREVSEMTALSSASPLPLAAPPMAFAPPTPAFSPISFPSGPFSPGSFSPGPAPFAPTVSAPLTSFAPPQVAPPLGFTPGASLSSLSQQTPLSPQTPLIPFGDSGPDMPPVHGSMPLADPQIYGVAPPHTDEDDDIYDVPGGEDGEGLPLSRPAIPIVSYLGQAADAPDIPAETPDGAYPGTPPAPSPVGVAPATEARNEGRPARRGVRARMPWESRPQSEDAPQDAPAERPGLALPPGFAASPLGSAALVALAAFKGESPSGPSFPATGVMPPGRSAMDASASASEASSLGPEGTLGGNAPGGPFAEVAAAPEAALVRRGVRARMPWDSAPHPPDDDADAPAERPRTDLLSAFGASPANSAALAILDAPAPTIGGRDSSSATITGGKFIEPKYGQITLIAAPLTVASAGAEQSGAVAQMDWRTLAQGAGTLDAGGMARLAAVLPPGARAIYPALPDGAGGPNAANLVLAPALVSNLLTSGYSVPGAAAAAFAAEAVSRARTTAPSGGAAAPLPAKIAPTAQRPIGSGGAGLLGGEKSDATPAGALAEAGGGSAKRGGAMDFLGMPVRLAPSLGGRAELAQEREARTPPPNAPAAALRPAAFGPLREKLFSGFNSVHAEPDETAWRKAAPAFGMRDASPTTLLSPDARAPRLTETTPLPQTATQSAISSATQNAIGALAASPFAVPTPHSLHPALSADLPTPSMAIAAPGAMALSAARAASPFAVSSHGRNGISGSPLQPSINPTSPLNAIPIPYPNRAHTASSGAAPSGTKTFINAPAGTPEGGMTLHGNPPSLPSAPTQTQVPIASGGASPIRMDAGFGAGPSAPPAGIPSRRTAALPGSSLSPGRSASLPRAASGLSLPSSSGPSRPGGVSLSLAPSASASRRSPMNAAFNPPPSVSSASLGSSPSNAPSPAMSAATRSLPALSSSPSGGSFAPAIAVTGAASSVPFADRIPGRGAMPLTPSRSGGGSALRLQRMPRGANSVGAASGGASASDSSGSRISNQESGNAAAEVELLANEVYAMLKRRLQNEAERRGKW